MPPIGRHGHSSSTPALQITGMSNVVSSANKHGAHRAKSSRPGKKNTSRSVGPDRQFETSKDTFYRAVEMGTQLPLTPRTANAGTFTRRLLQKEWNLLQEFDCVDNLLQEEADYRRIQGKRHMHREALQQQRNEIRERLVKEKQDWRTFGQSLEEDAIEYRREEQCKALQRREDDLAERRARDAQWEDMQRRKEAERALEKSEVDKMIDAARAALHQEEQKRRAKTEEQKLWSRTAKAQNEAALNRKRDEKLADAAEDKRLIHMQREMLDKAEQERVLYFSRLKGKQEGIQAAFEKNAGAADARRNQLEEERVSREIAERAVKERENAEKKEKWLSDLNKEGVAAVQRQLDEQALQRQKQREEDQKFGAQFMKDAELFKQEEEKKIEKRRRLEKENAQFLLNQMASHKKLGKFGENDMSKTEQAMNHLQLKKAKDTMGQEAIFRNKQLQLLLSMEKNAVGSPKSDRVPIDITKNKHNHRSKR
eukprot:GEMP01019231.1.p1 GENE.GEMP01019231.1~~GEMP01019231.1.p1  ORF type:complete len:482 (+),score=143.71 GEMP01019231.1:107-1552(+)